MKLIEKNQCLVRNILVKNPLYTCMCTQVGNNNGNNHYYLS